MRNFSELAEPQKLIPYFLRPEMSNLTPDIVAVYLHAAVKVFGYWAAELAQRWSWANDDLLDVKEIVDSMVVGMKEFVTSPHIEVQERVGLLQWSITYDRTTNDPLPEGSERDSTIQLHPS